MISQNDGVKLTTPTLPREEAKMSHTHVTAPTQFVEVKGIRFAYRQFVQKHQHVERLDVQGSNEQVRAHEPP
jgi:hypothetical protein